MSSKAGSGFKVLLLLSIPGLLFLLITIGDTYKISWLGPGRLIVGTFVLLLSISAIQKRRRLTREGFKPKLGGFSAEAEILMERIMKRRNEVEEAVRFQKQLPPLPVEFFEYSKEVIATANLIDKKEILPQLNKIEQEDKRIEILLEAGASMSVHENEVNSYLNLLDTAAAELAEYTASVRARGGLYKLSEREFYVSSFLIFLFVTAGSVLIWMFRIDRNWLFWLGCSLVGLGGFIFLLLRSVLKDQEPR